MLWSLAIPTLVQAEHANAARTGGDRIAGILTHFVDDLITAEYFRSFLRREPARALRLLTTKESPIQRRYVATADWLVRRDLGDAPLGGAIAPADLAYLLVRLSESFTYADLISGDTPSADRARVAFRLTAAGRTSERGRPTRCASPSRRAGTTTTSTATSTTPSTTRRWTPR